MIELIVVIAIIGVLAGILIPSLIGYVGKANRRVDASNARQIYNDIMEILLTDDTLYDGYKDGKARQMTAMEAWENTKGSTVYATVWESGSVRSGGATYKLAIGAYMDSYPIKGNGSQAEKLTWHPGNNEKTAFAAALRKFQSQKQSNKISDGCPTPLKSKSLYGYKTNRWYICWPTKGNVDDFEIWVGDATDDTNWRTNLYYRLWPDCCAEYQ